MTSSRCLRFRCFGPLTNVFWWFQRQVHGFSAGIILSGYCYVFPTCFHCLFLCNSAIICVLFVKKMPLPFVGFHVWHAGIPRHNRLSQSAARIMTTWAIRPRAHRFVWGNYLPNMVGNPRYCRVIWAKNSLIYVRIC